MSKREMMDSLERPGLFKEVKVVLVGPAKCGKTALIQRFVNDTFSDNYIPTGFEKYSTKSKIGDYTIEYSIWDTSGSGSYDTVRPLAYQDAQAFILCFNVGEPESLEHAIHKWLPEVRAHCNVSTPIILCGCKADIRLMEAPDTNLYMNQGQITREQAYMACQHIGATGYVETSSFYPGMVAVVEVFHKAAEAALGISLLDCNSSLKTPKKKRKIYSIGTLGKTSPKQEDTRSEVGKSSKNCCLM
ncbi:unnamed protein product [Hermetia illucens]|uniref:Uncharacterized protein n=1 Tax=Hermetia illucens TaxID=343691 RepID=A0A7R8UU58_HERIL|nr:ras-like GTP-binding protein rhoA [Hermetia illucens]XP_037916969.1 ras-like GTP-binding protein rhoA [Hermetia illucens]CAD7086725.1 unnamed protein product [Hermetia illucens]